MKTFIFFDIDGTIFSHKQVMVLPNTVKLINELASNPDYHIGIATGRGPGKIEHIDCIKDKVEYFVLSNGAINFKGDKLDKVNIIKSDTVKEIVDYANKKKLTVCMVSYNDEAVNFWDEEKMQNEEMEWLRKFFSTVDPLFYEKNAIFQMRVFSRERNKLDKFAKKFKGLSFDFWNSFGMDIACSNVNKITGIRDILRNEEEYRLITVGDGLNDLKMIESADIGIAMGNAKYDIVKEKADFIAPNIEEDQLYDVFKKLGII